MPNGNATEMREVGSLVMLAIEGTGLFRQSLLWKGATNDT